MTAVALRQDSDAQGAEPSGQDGMLNRIRMMAMECRLARKPDTELICALRHQNERISADACLSALLRLLPIAMDKRVTFLRPGSSDRSFDESWLLRLIQSVRSGDTDSLVFTLGSRVPRHFHAPIRFLAERYAEMMPSEP